MGVPGRHMYNSDKVKEFMTAFGQEVKEKPELPSLDIQDLRVDLITEELYELETAFKEKDLVEVTDALADLLYVVYGCAHACGIPITAAFNRVHSSNMSKLGEDGKPIYRKDGKVMKGPNYSPPDLEGLIKRVR